MALPPFEIEIDRARRFVKVTFRGYWDVATFEQYAKEYIAAQRLVNALGGRTCALVDGREFAVQSVEISQKFKELVADVQLIAAQRIATVVPALLNKLQAKRASDSTRIKLFTDMGEAERWLFEDAGCSCCAHGGTP